MDCRKNKILLNIRKKIVSEQKVTCTDKNHVDHDYFEELGKLHESFSRCHSPFWRRLLFLMSLSISCTISPALIQHHTLFLIKRI